MCGGANLKKVINMGKNPLVNSLLEKDEIGTEKVYSLCVKQCQECHLVQIPKPISANKIYKDEDYLYFSGDMPKLDEYFKEYASDLIYRFAEAGMFVLEIGSNDGLMLKNFSGAYKVLGVDPASNVVVRALKNGIPTISDFFSKRLAESIVREFGKAKIIYGNNCIAHLDDLKDLMKGIRVLLKDNGVFVVECNYWGGMVKNKNYALIYHDHFSYFTIDVWNRFLDQYGMEVFDAIITPAQGGSLRFFASFKGKYQATERLMPLIREEQETKLNNYETCQKYEIEVKEEAKKLNETINRLKSEGKKIAGYGAAAKGFSVLKLADIDQRHIDYFVDDSPAKQGKYTPVSHIPVISRQEAQHQLPDYFFITAPNYETEIVAKEQKYLEQGGHFVNINGKII